MSEFAVRYVDDPYTGLRVSEAYYLPEVRVSDGLPTDAILFIDSDIPSEVMFSDPGSDVFREWISKHVHLVKNIGKDTDGT